jgi:hypothetical protein
MFQILKAFGLLISDVIGYGLIMEVKLLVDAEFLSIPEYRTASRDFPSLLSIVQTNEGFSRGEVYGIKNL